MPAGEDEHQCRHAHHHGRAREAGPLKGQKSVARIRIERGEALSKHGAEAAAGVALKENEPPRRELAVIGHP